MKDHIVLTPKAFLGCIVSRKIIMIVVMVRIIIVKVLVLGTVLMISQGVAFGHSHCALWLV